MSLGQIHDLVLFEHVDRRARLQADWPTDRIAIIDSKTGGVTGWLDLTDLYPRSAHSDAVLNGIAWLPETRHLLVTGKLWPKLYEIELISSP